MSTTLSASLKKEIPDFLSTKKEQPSKAKIQKVQPYLRERKYLADYYFPKLVSIGPIHHHKNSQNNNLERGEQYKKMWALTYIEHMEGTEAAEKKVEKLLNKILSDIKALRDLYTQDAIQGHDDDEELAWMFFIDGCAVLHFMEKANFTSSDGVEIKVDQQVIVQHDLLLLENQLPYRVLKLLSNDDDAKLLSNDDDAMLLSNDDDAMLLSNDDDAKLLSNDDDAKLRGCIDKFLQKHPMIPDQESNTKKKPDQEQKEVRQPNQESNTEKKPAQEHKVEILPNPKSEPTHLLDHLRSAILHLEGDNEQKGEQQNNPQTKGSNCLDRLSKAFHCRKSKKSKHKWPTHRNIQELKTSGIGFRPHKKARLTDISFKGSKIFLSALTVDDFTASTFLNMIAYEMCPDFKNNYEISSYMSFMNSLIDHADDVKELRRVGVVHNALGSDEDVANIFNTVSTDMVLDTPTYVKVRNKIEEHYRNKFNIRMTEVYHKHFSSPWGIIGLLAAFLGLFLTIVQTVLAFRP